MKKIYLLSCLLIFSISVNAQTKTFVGTYGSAWSNINNWSPIGLPGPGNQIIINNNATVEMDASASVGNISLSSGSKLIINPGITLSIPKTSSDAFTMGTGTTLEVSGKLLIGGDATANIATGLRTGSTSVSVLIKSSGKISIDRCQTAINFITGTLTNNGNLEIGQQGTITTQGIRMQDVDLVNGGNILIDNVQGPALTTGTTAGSRIFTNTGTVRIGNIGNITGTGIIASDAVITNSATGSIYIDRTANAMQLTNGSFTTAGDLEIGNVATVTGAGIITSGTTISSSGSIIIKNTQNDGMQFSGGSFTNDYGQIYIGANGDITGSTAGSCGGIGIKATNGTIISNSGYIAFGVVGSHAIQLQNNSAFTNSSWLTGGVFADISGSMMTLENSTFTNTVAGTFYALGEPGDGINMNSTSHFENRGNIQIFDAHNTALSLNGSSDFHNYGTLAASAEYGYLNRCLYIVGGSLFENHAGTVTLKNLLMTNTQPALYIGGAGSKLINRATLILTGDGLVNLPSHAIAVDLQATLENTTGGLLRVVKTLQNGIELTNQGKVTNAGTIELNDITNIPLHATGGSLITNDGTVKIGNGSINTKTGLLIEGTNTRFENNAAGQITVNRTGAAYNGVQVTTEAVFQNDGKITWGTASLAFPGSAALQVVNSGLFDNRVASSILEFVNCANDAIVSDVNSPSTGSTLYLSGYIKFGNIAGRGFYNSDPNYVISNTGRFETLPGGKMNLQARVDNPESISVLSNNDGTVTLAYPFSNNGTVTNGGTITNMSTFTNGFGGLVSNNGTWNMTGTFNNNSNSVCRGTGTFQGSVFRNNAGTVAPGNSPGCMNMADGLLNQTLGILDIEVNGKNTPCTEFDRLNVTGTATLSGTLKVTFGGGYTGTAGDRITILKSTSLSGTFDSHNLPAGWTVSYNQPATGDVTLNYLSTLPLTLLDFTVRKEGDKANATWTTSNEVNTSHFELERSENGSQFQRLVTIPAVNTPGDHHYQCVDPLPLAGRNYYRLRMADIDGRYTYSPVVLIDMNKPQSTISSIYPNPAKDIVNITVTESRNDLSVQLVSLEGKIFLTKQLATRGNYELNMSKLSAGIYFIKTSYGETYKLIKQ